MASVADPVAIAAWQCVTSAGCGTEALWAAIHANVPRLAPIRLFPLPFDTVVGEFPGTLPSIRPELVAYACRNARLALEALNTDGFRAQVETVIARHGPDRLGLVLGTSTSGIYDSERAYAHFIVHNEMPGDFDFLHQHAIQATAQFIGLELGIEGPVYAISTACSSSAKALGSAQRLLRTGVCDAVLVAGVDTLCRLTLRGFHSLELVSTGPCKPMDAERHGINIGEAAALLLLECSNPGNRHCPHLLAVGESSDAHHMSAPDPQGRGAGSAMRAAMTSAGLVATEIGYVNLHATATPLNDLSEARAVATVVGSETPCSGVKGVFGHTLGASGALETIVTLESLRAGQLPGTCGLQQLDPDCPLNVLKAPETADVRYALCNAFGFGGSNASILLARSGEELTPIHNSSLRHNPMTTGISLRGWAVCGDETALADGIDIDVEPLDPKRLPAAIRRRTSQATRLALCAALTACQRAGIEPLHLPALFASVGGEMQVTDQLCIQLARSDGWISPTQFHNSVHNTAAGYWSIITGSRQATTAMGAAGDTVAMAWLEAWCRIKSESPQLLVVCYDERWPAYLEPGMGRVPVALAFVLEVDETGRRCGPLVRDSRVLPAEDLRAMAGQAPVLAVLPLLKQLRLSGAEESAIKVPLGEAWCMECE